MLTQGTANADVLNGGAGDDTLYGLSGNDKLNGAGGADVLTGDAGNDSLNGGAGEDYLMGGAGADTLDGGADADWASYEDAGSAVKVDLNLTAAQNTGGGGADTLKNIENLYGSAFNDTLIGNGGVNHLYGGAGDDSLSGGGGDDHFEGGAGADTINGGSGDDIVSYEDGLAGGVAVDLATGVATGHGTDTLISIEAIWASSHDDVLTGGDSDNYIYGGAGADLIKGGKGDDVLDGADGNDTVAGGAGADYLTGGAGDDLFQVAIGDSTLASSDQIADFAAGDRLDFAMVRGTSANYVENTAATLAAATTQANAAFAADSALRYVATQVGSDVQLFAADADGGEAHSLVTLKGATTASLGFENIVGTAPVTPVDPHLITGTDGADALAGTAAPDTINGLAGADTITGGGSADVLSGGGGDDLFRFAPGDSVHIPANPTQIASFGDTILDFDGGTRGAGAANGSGDQLDFGLTQGTAASYVENTAASASIAATQASAAFAANSALRYVATQVGENTLLFAADADGGEAHSAVTLKGVSTASLGFNNIAGTAPVDPHLIVGTDGAEFLSGSPIVDTIRGLAGDDTIIGSGGSDVLTGGAGNDVFVFGPGDSGLIATHAYATNDRGEPLIAQLVAGSGDVITDFQGGSRAASTAGWSASGTGDVLSFRFPANAGYIEQTVAPADEQAFAENFLSTGSGYAAVQVGGDVHLYYRGDVSSGMVTLQGATLADISAANIQPGSTDLFLIGENGGPGNDTVVSLGVADEITGGAGSDLFVFEYGSSGELSNASAIFDFTGTASRDGVPIVIDRLDFGLDAGTSSNYAELTTAPSDINAVFAANPALRYLAINYDSWISVHHSDADGGESRGHVSLYGATLDQISPFNIAGKLAPQVFIGTGAGDLLTGNVLPNVLIGGDGVDILQGMGGDTIVGGKGGDAIYLSGANLLSYADGDSGVFENGRLVPGSYDRLQGWRGEAHEDRFDFGLGAATSSNFLSLNVWGTVDETVAAAQAAAAANHALRYIATPNFLFHTDADGGELHGAVYRTPGDYMHIFTAGDIAAPAANLNLTGGAGRDILIGGDGQDTLNGKAGNDVLTGGVGADRFILGQGESGEFVGQNVVFGTADTIVDFQTGVDAISFGAAAGNGASNYQELDLIFANYIEAQQAVHNAFTATPALAYVAVQVASDTYVFADTGGGPDADSVVFLQGVSLSSIAATDIA